MRYRLTRSVRKRRAQVMTPPHLARRLLDFLPGSGQSWLELGSGDGRIAQACLEMREPSEFIGVEVDDPGVLQDVDTPADLAALQPKPAPRETPAE